MSSGKVHESIGIATAGVLYTGASCLVTKSFVPADFAIIVFGAAVGSLLPDIDSKKSIASQWFFKIVCSISLIAVLMAIVKFILKSDIQMDLSKYVGSFLFIGDYFISSYIGLIFFIIFVIIGKFSNHRGFTHRILGTTMFIIIALATFHSYLSLGLIIGYLAHLIADATTPAGLKFFELKKPFN